MSIQVGRPRDVEWRGRSVRTSIFKEPVEGPVVVRTLNLEGDEQSDLSVHGGVDKAVYAYPSEHYPAWGTELAGVELPWGAFGENLTTHGLGESTLRIGDLLTIGSAQLRVTQPRMPCFKLGIRLGRPDVVKRLERSGRTGFYLAVVREGSIRAGDAIRVDPTPEESFTVAEIHRLHMADDPDPELLRRAIGLEGLAASWREHLRERLERSTRGRPARKARPGGDAMSSYKPDGYPSLSPYLIVNGAARTIEFLVRAFDGVELRRFPAPDGRILHAEVKLDDGVLMLSDGNPDWPPQPAHVHLYVPDVDAAYRRALAAGATSVQEPVRKDDPDRRGGVKDAGGTTWWIATLVG